MTTGRTAMDVVLGLAVMIAIVLAVRSGLRSSSEARARAEEARRALVQGARSGVGPDRTRPTGGRVDEEAARLREDAAFFEGVIFSNNLLPEEIRERLPGYREHDDGEIDPAELAAEPHSLLDEFDLDGVDHD